MHAVRGFLGCFLPCFRESAYDDNYSDLRDDLERIDTSNRGTDYFNALNHAFKACCSFSYPPDIASWGLPANLTSDFIQLLQLKQSHKNDLEEECQKAIKSGIPLYIVSEIVGDSIQLEDERVVKERYIEMLREDCPLCMETIEETDFIAKTLLRVGCCGNFLHTTCLDQWVKKSCVHCRANFDRQKNSANWARILDKVHIEALTSLGLRDEEIAKKLELDEKELREAQIRADEAFARKIALQITLEA